MERRCAVSYLLTIAPNGARVAINIDRFCYESSFEDVRTANARSSFYTSQFGKRLGGPSKRPAEKDPTRVTGWETTRRC